MSLRMLQESFLTTVTAITVFNHVTSCLYGSLPQREGPQHFRRVTKDTSPRFASKSTPWSQPTSCLAQVDSLLKSFQFRSPARPSITLQQWWVWVHFCVREDFFYRFINAESTVSTFNNTIEVKVSIHQCIFWECSADTFWEDNLVILDDKIYP
jgi:hypothetical protein